MSEFSFFIYDYETFGVDPKWDRPAQFAGIRTDKDFNIIGEPVMFYCQQSNDYLPHPQSVLITGITPQQCNTRGLSEPEFAKRILAEFSQPNTCIMGFNNIRFDDEATRFLFYRNFIDAYEYSWKNNNSRWDLIDVVRACYALRPEGIHWPKNEEGELSFKLEDLTRANHINHEQAHDAMSDVYATIAVAKLIKQKQPELFRYFFEMRGKKEVEALIDTINMKPLVHVSGMFGNNRGNVSWVMPLAWHPLYNNRVITCDLAGNVESLLHYSVEELRQDLYTPTTELVAKNKSRIPLKEIHMNKCPILMPATQLTPERALSLGIDRERCLANYQLIKCNPQIRRKIEEIFRIETTFPAANNVEGELYNGFFSNADRKNMEILRQLPLEKLNNHQLMFKDARIEKLLFHYRAKYSYALLSRGEQIRWQKYRQSKLNGMIGEFEQEMERLIQEHSGDESKLALLQQLYEYAQKIVNFT